MAASIKIFDGHNDVLLRLLEDDLSASDFLEGNSHTHIDLPRARRGGFVGGLFACYTPSENPPAKEERPGGYATPLPAAPTVERAQRYTMALMARLFRLEEESKGGLRVCRSVADIRECVDGGIVAAVLHIEGAEAIDHDFESLEVFHRAGLRSLGPVWSRVNAFGSGVPFDYPGTPDVGAGLSDLGKELVAHCNRLGILLDLSHLNEKGFWDVARLSQKPLVASHSNAHAVCPVPRNLTDAQLDAIGESDGLVGLNFAVGFLKPEGGVDPQMPLEVMVRHLDHLVDRLGVGGVALGSDFDGCTLPSAIGDVAGLPVLVEELRRHGYDEETLERICFENWLDVLERTWA